MSNVTTSSIDKQASSNNSNNNANTSEKKLTWFPSYLTLSEFIKKGLEPKVDEFAEEWYNENMLKVTKGKFTRKIPSIKRIQTDDDKEWLDWFETREGKSPMQQKKVWNCPHVGKKKVPIPREETQFNMETEEYDTVITGTKEYVEEYHVPFSKEALAELLQDINPYKTQFGIEHEGQRGYSVTKQEIGLPDFNKLYESKQNPTNNKK
jgi:hypothetical protein